MIGNDPKGTSKLDSAPASGLLGTPGSMAYVLAEIERHFHNTEKWFGAAAVPDGETHVADRMAGGIQPFVLTAGDNDFGPWVQIFGSGDTPATDGMVEFDAHRFLVTDTSSTNTYLIQVVSGESSGIAAKIAAEQFSEAAYISATNNNDSGVEEIMVRRTDVGEKVWARCICIGSNGSTISLYPAIHEYEG